MSLSNLLLIEIQNHTVTVSLCNSVGKVLDEKSRLFDCHHSSDFGKYADANEFLYATRSAINSLNIVVEVG